MAIDLSDRCQVIEAESIESQVHNQNWYWKTGWRLRTMVLTEQTEIEREDERQVDERHGDEKKEDETHD